MDPSNLPKPPNGKIGYGHLPPGVKPWKNLFSAGQGMALIEDIPSVAELVGRLRDEYVVACATPDMADAAARTQFSP